MRIKLQFPNTVIFHCELPVRITDLNYGNHLGNDRILSIAHEARVQWLQSIGYTEMDMDGHGLIMADAIIQFKAEAFYGDQLTVELAIQDITPNAFDIYYQITTLRSSKKITIALAKTAMISYSYTAKKVVLLSTKVLTLLQKESI